jgi:hypothetical protein
MVQLTIKNPFAHMFSFGLDNLVLDAPAPERLIIGEKQSYTLPREVTRIRVLSGTAWVSHLGNNILLYRGQTMQFKPEHLTVITTAGFKAVQLELTQ